MDFDYNNRGLLQYVSVDGPPPAFELGYDNSGLKTSVVSEIGVTEARGYDGAGRLTSVGYSQSGNVVHDATTYTLNNVGLRTSLSRADGTVDAYGYDNIRQVTAGHVGGTSTTLPATPNRTYTFDAAGNRTASSQNSVTTAYTPNAVNAYTSVGGVARTHDLNGNLTNDGTRTLIWDIKDRLKEVRIGSDTIAEYRYDAFGRRIARNYLTNGLGSTSKLIRYVYDVWNVVAEHESDQGGSLTLARRNIWGHDLSGKRSRPLKRPHWLLGVPH